jgi:hypothetical protein
MSERTISHDGRDELKKRYPFESERMRLSREWHQVYGTDIPYRVEALGPDEIRKALKHGRQKMQPVSETSGNDDSLAFEDNHNNLT